MEAYEVLSAIGTQGLDKLRRSLYLEFAKLEREKGHSKRNVAQQQVFTPRNLHASVIHFD